MVTYVNGTEATITTQRDGDLANVYADGACVAIMERRPHSKTWFYNPSTAERFSPAFFPTWKSSLPAAAKIAAQHGIARRELEQGS